MRIISGKHRGRKIETPESKNLRPTTGRTREALFSILTSGRFVKEGTSFFADKTVVDVFCGTGILGFEALSRGAGQVIFIDQDSDKLQTIRNNAAKLKEEPNCSFIRRDVQFLPVARQPCMLAFIDPPYNLGLVDIALKTLDEKDWLEGGAIIVVEHGISDPFTIPSTYEVIDERKYGISNVTLLQYHKE